MYIYRIFIYIYIEEVSLVGVIRRQVMLRVTLPKVSFSPESGGSVKPRRAMLEIDQNARHDQVEKIVQRPPADLYGEGDVDVRLRTALVHYRVLFARHSCNENPISVTRTTRNVDRDGTNGRSND